MGGDGCNRYGIRFVYLFFIVLKWHLTFVCHYDFCVIIVTEIVYGRMQYWIKYSLKIIICFKFKLTEFMHYFKRPAEILKQIVGAFVIDSDSFST